MGLARIRYVKSLLASRSFLILFASLLAISFSVTYVASESRAQERFLSISTLDSNMMTERYFPEGSSISVGESAHWYVSVYNKMDNHEFISIRMKLLNSTQPTPDHNSIEQVSENHIFEFKQLVMKNSTWVIPLNWSVIEVGYEEDYVVLNGLQINDIDVWDIDIKSVNGTDFRMIFELWRYDPEYKDFVFKWQSDSNTKIAWNQIWFNIKE